MKVLFDSRLYVLDNELRYLANHSSLYIMERRDMNDVGGIHSATSVPVQERGHSLERLLSRLGWQITLPTYYKQYKKIVETIQPDVLVVNDFFRFSSFQALRYKKRHPYVRLVLVCETKKWPKRWVSKLFMHTTLHIWKRHTSLVEKVIIYTDASNNFFASHWPEVKLYVLPPSIDTDIFKPVRNREYIPKGVLRIVMNARYYHYKRHDILLSALALLCKQGLDFKLTLVSRNEMGKNSVIKYIQEQKLEDMVEFSPSLTKLELAQMMSEQDVLVLPSYNEAIGMVVPEAMACGVVTITSDTVGANVYVQNGQTGLIFETDNVQQLSDCLRRCYDRSRLQNMGTAATEVIHNHYASRTHSRRLAELIV